MTKIQITDLEINSISFINEVAETESEAVNGGLGLLDAFVLGYGGFALEISKILQNSFLKGTAMLVAYDLAK
ncbi:MAG: hypothetical protein KME64_23175 [Scytonematopsis contorta HA4267-MV1]|jgi:hypothetical protein|nr:hypothetical protein [Scytonematopsis contorta HA4267-MV1]